MLEKQISKGDVANYGFNAGGAPLSFDFRIAGHSAPMLNRMETCTGWLGLATEAASAAVLLLCVKFLQLLQECRALLHTSWGIDYWLGLHKRNESLVLRRDRNFSIRRFFVRFGHHRLGPFIFDNDFCDGFIIVAFYSLF